jgi:hypothetical protein
MKDQRAKHSSILIRSTLSLADPCALYKIEISLTRKKKSTDSLKNGELKANAVSHHTAAAGSGGGAIAPYRLLLARVKAACAGGGGARGAELRLHPEAGALHLQPQHPRRVPPAGQAARPAYQGPDHRYEVSARPAAPSSPRCIIYFSE